MKIFHIRIDGPSYNSNAISKAFMDLGHQYVGYDWQRHRFEYGLDQLRVDLAKIASELRPDYIFAHIQNSEILELYDWKKLNKCGKVINFTFDVRKPNEMSWMYEVAPFIHHTVFGSVNDVAYCNASGTTNVSHSHSSCDMEIFKPLGKNSYAFDVVFCGNRYDNTNLDFPLAEERELMVQLLENEYGSRFMTYGLGRRGGLIRPDVESNVYNFSKIAINQNNFSLRGYTSDRLWRIMASGTFCLTKYFPGIEDLFEDGVHLAWWNSFEELKDKADFYLKDDEERKAIARVGCAYVRENHTWKDRIEKIFSNFGKTD